MNPINVPARDWSLYYSRCVMVHDTYGAVYVEPDGNNFIAYPMIYEGLPNAVPDCTPLTSAKTVSARKLRIWFPPSGSYTTKNGAVYLGRKANRCMKKSAAPDAHYWVKWASAGYNRVNVAQLLCSKREYMSLDDAIKAIKEGKRFAAALCRSVIISNVPEEKDVFHVIYRGESVGTLHTFEGTFPPQFNANNDFNPSIKLAFEELSEVGIL